MHTLLSNNVLALLPEYLLTIAGVLVMLADPLFGEDTSREPLGWFAILGTIAAGAATWYQHTQIAGAVITGFAGTVQADSFSVFFHFVIAAAVLSTLLGSLTYFRGHASHSGEYFALVLFGAVGMMLMTCSTELLMVFIGLEISSISTYIMTGFRKGEASASESAIKYFLLGSFATAFFLYGVALTFGATGSTSIYKIAPALAHTATPALAVLAVAMIVIGLGFKVSAAPFHVWTPDVYQGAPSPVVGLMSTAPKAAAFAVLLRILYAGFPVYQAKWSFLLWIVAALSMTIGNLGALLQKDVKRMLAYSSIAHAGYLLVAFTAYQQEGIASAAFYTAAYAAMNIGAFLVLSQIAGFREDLRTVDEFSGVALRHPVLSAALAFFLLSMIGIPFTGGFFAKFYVFTAAMHAGHVWLTVLGLLNSGVACFYYLRLLMRVYANPAEAAPHDAPAPSASAPAAIAISLCAVTVLLLGILPGHALSMARQAASSQPGLIIPAAQITQEIRTGR